MKSKLTPILVFSILMQKHSGEILDKSPSYIIEKFNFAMQLGDNAECLLDNINLGIFKQYLEKWIIIRKSGEEGEVVKNDKSPSKQEGKSPAQTS